MRGTGIRCEELERNPWTCQREYHYEPLCPPLHAVETGKYAEVVGDDPGAEVRGGVRLLCLSCRKMTADYIQKCAVRARFKPSDLWSAIGRMP